MNETWAQSVATPYGIRETLPMSMPWTAVLCQGSLVPSFRWVSQSLATITITFFIFQSTFTPLVLGHPLIGGFLPLEEERWLFASLHRLSLAERDYLKEPAPVTTYVISLRDLAGGKDLHKVESPQSVLFGEHKRGRRLIDRVQYTLGHFEYGVLPFRLVNAPTVF